MNFAMLNASVNDLRSGLISHTSNDNALHEINSRPPTGENDEASFLRLTTWCYILIFEAGRVSIPYLLKVSSPIGDSVKQDRGRETREIVNVLRSWCFHNLNFDDGKRRDVSKWFIDTCRVIAPTKKNHWKLCFKKLCSEMIELVSYCNEVLSRIATSPDDNDIIFTDLKRRLKRNWPACEFDKIVLDAANLIGEKIDHIQFRNSRINKWRMFLEQLPEDVELEKEVMRIIERDVFDYFRSMLPITTKEIMAVLDLTPGPEVKKAITLARELFDNGIRDPRTLTDQLFINFKKTGGAVGDVLKNINR